MARAIATRGFVDWDKTNDEKKENEENEENGEEGKKKPTFLESAYQAGTQWKPPPPKEGKAGMKVKAIKGDDNVFGGPGSVDKALNQIANNPALANIFSNPNLKNIYSKILASTAQTGSGRGMLTQEGLGNILTYVQGNVSVPEDADQEYIKGLVQELSKGYHNTFGDVGEKDVMLNPFLLSIEDIKTIEGN